MHRTMLQSRLAPSVHSPGFSRAGAAAALRPLRLQCTGSGSGRSAGAGKDKLEKILQASTIRRSPSSASKPQNTSSTSSQTRHRLALAEAEIAALKASRAPSSTSTREQLDLVMAELGRSHELQVRSMFNTSVAAVEVAFLVDCTASMGQHIKAVGDQVCLVASEIQKRYGNGGNRAIRFAFVGYRDYGDVEVPDQDFTTDLQTFKAYVSQLKVAPGNMDWTEDVYSGLEKLGNLSWGKTGKDGVSNSKLIFHLADAACHGSRYHDHGTGGDNYTGGDMKGRQIAQLLRRLRVERGVHSYHFSHITSHTRIMLDRFHEECGEQGWITEDKMGKELERLSASVLTVVAKTVAASFTKSVSAGAGKIKDLRRYQISKKKPQQILWSSISAVQGSIFKCQLPESLPALLQGVANKKPLKEVRASDEFFLSVAPHPFSDEGAQRLPFYAMGVKASNASNANSSSSKDWLVAKVFRDGSRAANLPAAYKRQMDMQSVAAFLAQEFNKAAAGGDMRPVRYVTSATWTGSTGSGGTVSYNLEQLVEGGRIVKFNNNAGYVNAEESSINGTLQAFSHWTWQATNGQLMVVDVQGLLDPKDNEYVLVDPAIHCPSDPARFTKTNLLDIGMKQFFTTHVCNDKCKALGLRPHPAQLDSDAITRRASQL